MLKFLLLMVLAISCAYADETEVRDHLQKKYSKVLTVEQVNKSSMPGLYEVVTPGHLFYTDEQAEFLIDGNIYELHTMRNITEERERKLFAVDFKSLPFDLALKEVKGNGKRKIFIFTDPNCGYCKKLEHELQKVDNVTVYRLLFPLFQGSDQKIRAVWCSKDRLKAWEGMMMDNVMPSPAPNCEYPFAKVMEWGRKMRINGTPGLIFADGMLVPGALPAEDLEKALDGKPVE